MEAPPLLQSLLPTTDGGPPPRKPADTTDISGIICRLILISFIGVTALWANHEASKGFSIAVVNEAGKHPSPAGKRFSLFYESNDEAARIVLNSSRFVESFLYGPNQHMIKKPIKGVTLRLAATEPPHAVAVESSRKTHEYVISISPSLMENSGHREAVVAAVMRGMARVWLWDGNGGAPPALLNGMVEYVGGAAGFPSPEVLSGGGRSPVCWKDEDPRRLAGFLRWGGGVVMIRRLNDGMRDGWDDRMVEDVLGMAVKSACAWYDAVGKHHHWSS